DARGDRPVTRRQSRDPPRAHDDPRGDGAGVLGPLSGARRVGVGDEAVRVHDAAGQPLRAVGPDGTERADSGAHGRPGPGRQARGTHDGRRVARDGRGEAQTVPGSRAAGGILRARLSLAHGCLRRSMTAASNLLAFLGLVITLLIVWRQSWPARLRLFAAQSLLLAALAGTVGVLAQRCGLLLVAAAVVVVKALVIPLVLARIGSGAPVRPIAPGRSSGITFLVAGPLVVVAYVIMLPVPSAAELPTEGAIPLAFAMALIGLALCVTGRDALGHILGFLVFENGIFGLAILATYGL